MDFRVLRISPPDEGGTRRLTLRCEGEGGEGRHTLRVSAEAFASLGDLSAGDMLDSATVEELSALEGQLAATERAVRVLSAGDNSRRMLYRKLRAKGYGHEAAEAAVKEMVSRGYLREDEAAYRYAVRVANGKCFGRRRVIRALLTRGYSAAVAEAAVGQAEADGEIDFPALRRELLSRADGDEEHARALLYKHGFSGIE